MSTFIDGIGQCQVLDKSGELVDLKGHDITSLDKTGTFTWEHQINTPATLVGKILKAKKIFSKDDCENERELYFWNKCKNPYLYVMGELLDDYTASAKECAGQMKYSKDKPGQAPLLGFSVEGSEIPNTRKGMIITRSIARKITLTQSPCNSMCIAEILESPEQKSQIKDDFEEIFKSEANAIEMFKSDQGLKIYETFLAKKESSGLCKLHKAEKPSWSAGKVSGDSVHYNHPEHGTVSIQKQPSGEFHVKHQGKLAGVGGVKGSFGTSKEAGAHAKKYMGAVSDKTIFAPKMHNISSESLLGKSDLKKAQVPGSKYPPKDQVSPTSVKTTSAPPKFGPINPLKKAITAGSYNATPGTLVNGAAYQVEDRGSRPAKKDWNKQAKDDYENWPHKEKFEKFMSARMPHLAMGEIKALGRALALKKNIEFEKSLSNLVSLKKSEEPKLGQDSSIYSNGGKHEMRYHHGEKAGKSHLGSGTEYHKEKPKDLYTTLPNGKHFTHNFDFDKLHDSKKVK